MGRLFFSLQILGVLSQDGVMRFININTCKLLFYIGSHDNAITTVAVGPNGRHVVAITDTGSINIYSVHSLTPELNKVTPRCDISPIIYLVAKIHGSLLSFFLHF